ncbi:MAG TPA: MBL fold metallo-hydrolase [Clostridia bacterium]|nr:MBL fold metallo-hydrolase [Clostridia bacterium]
MSVKLTFYGAVNEIGGSKTRLEYGGTNLFLDFGKDFVGSTDHFSDRLKPAAYLQVRDYLRFGNLPPMAALYPPAQSQFLQQEFRAALDSGTVEGILLSHGHIDHVGFLPLVDVSVPLYMSAETLEVLRFFDETGQFDLRMDQRHVTVFEHDKVMRIGDCEVLPVRSDHDILGILGFIVRCGDTSIIYTGDYRLHGKHPERVRTFFELMRQEKQRAKTVLLTEGTRLGFGSVDQLTESEIQELATRAVGMASGLVMTNYYILDTDRLKVFLRVAEKTGRTMVLQPQHMLMARKFARFDSELERLIKNAEVYLARRGSGRYLAPDYQLFEQEHLVTALRAADIAAEPARYMLQLDFPDLGELVEIDPAPHTVFIQSGGEPLGQYDPNYGILMKWVKDFRMDFYRIATPGHASELDIRDLVMRADPSVLVPMHSKAPEALSGYVKDTVALKKGVTYEF